MNINVRALINFVISICFPTALLAQGVWIGPGVPLQTATIQNMTNTYCTLVAYGETFADIGPGDTAYAGPQRKGKGFKKIVSLRGGFGWYAQSNNIQIPVAALCFADKEKTAYVGVATTVLNVPGGGYSSGSLWVIRPGDVQPFNANRPIENQPFRSALALKTVKMPFPGPLASSVGTLAIQIINNSPYALLARTVLNGVQETWVSPGEIYYLPIKTYAAVVIDIKAENLETKNIVGVWSETTYGQFADVSAQNIILNAGSFR